MALPVNTIIGKDKRNFRDILRLAIADMAVNGYQNYERIDQWINALRNAAERDIESESVIDEELRRTFGAIYAKMIERGGVAKYVPGVARFNLSMVRPELRAELDRRIMASADLIKLHRREAINTTLTRFSGWATSIPPQGDDTVSLRSVQSDIGKSVAQFKFEKRRVAIDQTHKLIGNINNIVAVNNGAIAGMWHSHGEHDKSYNARKDHLKRAGKVYAIKGSWAVERGLINKGAGYLEDMTAPGQEVFCRCYVTYIISPRRVPETMLTAKGKMWLSMQSTKMAA